MGGIFRVSLISSPGNYTAICVCMSIEWLLSISCSLPVGRKHGVFQQEAPVNRRRRHNDNPVIKPACVAGQHRRVRLTSQPVMFDASQYGRQMEEKEADCARPVPGSNLWPAGQEEGLGSSSWSGRTGWCVASVGAEVLPSIWLQFPQDTHTHAAQSASGRSVFCQFPWCLCVCFSSSSARERGASS